jgi:hypothetical protein
MQCETLWRRKMIFSPPLNTGYCRARQGLTALNDILQPLQTKTFPQGRLKRDGCQSSGLSERL